MRSEVWSRDGWLKGVRRINSDNFGMRPAATEVSLVVIHNISLPPGEFGGDGVEHFFTNRLDPAAHPYFASIADLQVSAHFFLRRDGEIVQFVAADHRAWHAGTSVWRGRSDCNDFSIGIELEGADEIPYATVQYEQLNALLLAVCQRYPIRDVAGHCHIAPGRKSDPGQAFDWDALRQGFPGLSFPDR
ncbi:MAG: ampD [Proteobacteria bacterium]|nr:ampD [Pseudomonadota bacterium]